MIEFHGNSPLPQVNASAQSLGIPYRKNPDSSLSSLSSMKESRTGLTHFFCSLYQKIRIFFSSLFSREYRIEGKSEEQIIEDFKQTPDRVICAFIDYYLLSEEKALENFAKTHGDPKNYENQWNYPQFDEEPVNEAEELLLRIAKRIPNVLKMGQYSFIEAVNHLFHQMAFSKNLLKVKKEIEEIVEFTPEVEAKGVEIQHAIAQLNSFLYKVMGLIKKTGKFENLGLWKREESEPQVSPGEFCWEFLKNHNLNALKNESFLDIPKGVEKDVLRLLFVLRDGRNIHIDQYPRFKRVLDHIRILCTKTDSGFPYRLWTTVSRLVKVTEEK